MTNDFIDKVKHHKNGNMRIRLNKGEQVFCSTMIMFFKMNKPENVVIIDFEDNDGTKYEASIRKCNGKSTLKILNEMKQKIKELESKLEVKRNETAKEIRDMLLKRLDAQENVLLRLELASMITKIETVFGVEVEE